MVVVSMVCWKLITTLRCLVTSLTSSLQTHTDRHRKRRTERQTDRQTPRGQKIVLVLICNKANDDRQGTGYGMKT